MRYGRTTIPNRDMERERTSTGSSEVKTWTMSPEELEAYKAKSKEDARMSEAPKRRGPVPRTEKDAALPKEANQLIAKLTAERDNWKAEYATLEQVYGEIKEDCENWKHTADTSAKAILSLEHDLSESRQAIAELEEERQILLQSIEREVEQVAAVQVAAYDAVNHPDHYTAGGIETIDILRAKLTPAEFLGYCKGNVIKYVTRSNLKGGMEDLRKAAKYLEFTQGAESNGTAAGALAPVSNG